MKRFLRAAAVALAVAATSVSYSIAQTTQADKAQASVPVRAVVLYSSGVGYFEHFGSIKDTSAAELRFKTAQINDILKSLVLEDLDNGKVSVVT